MADNSTRTPGTGEEIASDDIGGVKHQRVKISLGVDGSAVDQVPALNATTARTTGLAAVVPHVQGSDTSYRPLTSPNVLLDNDSAFFTSAAAPYLYNGTTYDRQRGNMEGTLLASAARTATTSSAAQTNYNARGVIVFLNVTAVPGSGGITTIIAATDPASGVSGWKLNPDATPVTATGTYAYLLYPGCSVTSTHVVQATPTALPRNWHVTVFHATGASYTYSVGYSMIV